MKTISFIAVALIIFALAISPASAAEKSKSESKPKRGVIHVGKAKRVEPKEKAKDPVKNDDKKDKDKDKDKNKDKDKDKEKNKDKDKGKDKGDNKGNGDHNNNGDHQNNEGRHDGGGHQYNGRNHDNGGSHDRYRNRPAPSRRTYHPRPVHRYYNNNDLGLNLFIDILGNMDQSWFLWHNDWDDWDQSWDRWDNRWDSSWTYRPGEAFVDSNFIERSLRDLVDRAHDEGITPVMRQIGQIRDTRTWNIDLPPGRYVILSSGGLNINDLDIRVIDPYGTQIVQDDEQSATPEVWFELYEGGNIQIETRVWEFAPGYFNDYECILLCRE
jgi:hypothetical protein